MQAKLILFPLFAMFVLTCIVAGTMLRRRVAYFKANRLHPQKVALSAQMAAQLPDTRAPDNFRNLFEVPVFFYAAVLLVFSAGLSNSPHLVLAWGFVAARAAHSYIQCTSNIVMRRFYAYLTSGTLLVLMWLLIVYQLVFVL